MSTAQPEYYVTTTVNDEVIGEFRQTIADPFARTVITMGKRDVLRSLFRRGPLRVQVHVDGNVPALQRFFRQDVTA